MDVKIVFNPAVTRRLLKMGCTIVDIKPDKNDRNKTVFVFLKDQKFVEAIKQLSETMPKKTEDC